jgi:hypothetical protein
MFSIFEMPLESAGIESVSLYWFVGAECGCTKCDVPTSLRK